MYGYFTYSEDNIKKLGGIFSITIVKKLRSYNSKLVARIKYRLIKQII